MKKRSTGKGSTSVIWRLLLVIVLTMGLTVLCAKLILSGAIGMELIDLCAGVISATVAMLLSLITTKKSPRKKLLWGLTASAVYYLALLVSNLLFFGIEFVGVLYSAAWVFGGGLLGTLLGQIKVRKYA